MKKLPFEKQIAMETLFTGHGPTTFKGKEHNLSRAYLVELLLEGAEMPGVILDGSKLQRARLTGSNLAGARLVLADLEEADLSGVNLENANLHGVNFTNATLREADLRGADLRLAKLQGACLVGAKFDAPGQLAHVASLYQAWGLPEKIEAELKERRPRLFQKPEKPDDDPDISMLRSASS